VMTRTRCSSPKPISRSRWLVSGDPFNCFTTTVSPARTRFSWQSCGVRQEAGWQSGTGHVSLTVRKNYGAAPRPARRPVVACLSSFVAPLWGAGSLKFSDSSLKTLKLESENSELPGRLQSHEPLLRSAHLPAAPTARRSFFINI
jgi:hypothetical protein